MAQKLFVRAKKADGSTTVKAVHVLRSWQESDGRQIWLHANGVYGYKDEAPVRSRDEFSIIGAPYQRKLAMAWWDRVGEKLSKAFYSARAEAEEARQLEGLPAVEGESSDLDAMMYARRGKASGRKKEAWSDPATWPEYGFKGRPDWWGFAESIVIAGFEYQVVAAEGQESGIGDQESEGKGQESGVRSQGSDVGKGQESGVRSQGSDVGKGQESGVRSQGSDVGKGQESGVRSQGSDVGKGQESAVKIEGTF